ncbi:glycoside hydrolase family 5 protein [Brevibacillus brevis]|uniref:glycoside hydrolase family 5 protein n=1 Tax=Brevibacillus brevis TaxID=1393 RepID=UPI001EDA1A13|nr:cellulase family glycosylhydrolase [Brevibacillus brevis]
MKKVASILSIVISTLMVGSFGGQYAMAQVHPMVHSPISMINVPISPWDYQKRLGKGIDVDWSKTSKGRLYYSSQTVQDFKEAGVSHVRIRIADQADEKLLQGLDKQIEDCLNAGIIPIIAYQADEFKNEPTEQNIQLVVDWWTKVAERYKDTSHLLAFDLLIEATDALNKQPEKLNQIFERLVTEIRKTNPTRIIMISPRLRSDADYLKELVIPSQHNNYLMAEWHFYASGPSKTNERKLWTTGTDAEKKLITDKINTALEWQTAQKIPTWVGAWMPGNYNDGNDYSIEEQTVFAKFMTSQLKAAGIPFAVNSDTKYYDRENNSWIETMQPVFNTIFHGTPPSGKPNDSTEIPQKPDMPNVHVGFNAKGSLDIEGQSRFLREQLHAMKKQGIKTEKIWLRLQGGSISQKTYPKDWSDKDIRQWATIQKEFGVPLVFVVNFNDSPENQLKFFKRLQDHGLNFSFIELGNEQYLPKFAESEVGEFKQVTKRTAEMTPQKYIKMSNEYIKAFTSIGLPFYVQFAPEKVDKIITGVWNNAIAQAINDHVFLTENIHGTIHLYERDGDGSLNAKQIGEVKRLVNRPMNIAITEFGVVDKRGKLSMQQLIAQEKNLTTRILHQLEKGDLLLNQVLYTDYKEVGAAVLHPKYDGITPKGKAIMELFKKLW